MEQVVAAGHALEMVGMPEAGLSLTQAIIFLCESPSPTASWQPGTALSGTQNGMSTIRSRCTCAIPAMRARSGWARGRDTCIPHDYPGHYIKQEYAPVSARGSGYHPSEEGSRRIQELRALRSTYQTMERSRGC